MLASALYAWLAMWTLLRSIVSAARAPGRRTLPTGIGRRAALGAGILFTLWLEGRVLGQMIVAQQPGAIGGEGQGDGVMVLVDAAAWLTLLLPLAAIATIAVLLPLLRPRAIPPAPRPGS